MSARGGHSKRMTAARRPFLQNKVRRHHAGAQPPAAGLRAFGSHDGAQPPAAGLRAFGSHDGAQPPAAESLRRSSLQPGLMDSTVSSSDIPIPRFPLGICCGAPIAVFPPKSTVARCDCESSPLGRHFVQ